MLLHRRRERLVRPRSLDHRDKHRAVQQPEGHEGRSAHVAEAAEIAVPRSGTRCAIQQYFRIARMRAATSAKTTKAEIAKEIKDGMDIPADVALAAANAPLAAAAGNTPLLDEAKQRESITLGFHRSTRTTSAPGSSKPATRKSRGDVTAADLATTRGTIAAFVTSWGGADRGGFIDTDLPAGGDDRRETALETAVIGHPEGDQAQAHRAGGGLEGRRGQLGHRHRRRRSWRTSGAPRRRSTRSRSRSTPRTAPTCTRRTRGTREPRRAPSSAGWACDAVIETVRDLADALSAESVSVDELVERLGGRGSAVGDSIVVEAPALDGVERAGIVRHVDGGPPALVTLHLSSRSPRGARGGVRRPSLDPPRPHRRAGHAAVRPRAARSPLRRGAARHRRRGRLPHAHAATRRPPGLDGARQDVPLERDELARPPQRQAVDVAVAAAERSATAHCTSQPVIPTNVTMSRRVYQRRCVESRWPHSV